MEKLSALASPVCGEAARHCFQAYLSMTAVDSICRRSPPVPQQSNTFPRCREGATADSCSLILDVPTNSLSSPIHWLRAEAQNAGRHYRQLVIAGDHVFYKVLENKALVVVAQQTVSSRQLS